MCSKWLVAERQCDEMLMCVCVCVIRVCVCGVF